MAQLVKNLHAIWDTWAQSLSWENPLEEGMATHSSIVAWRIPMDRGAWRATIHGVAESGQTEWLSTSQKHRWSITLDCFGVWRRWGQSCRMVTCGIWCGLWVVSEQSWIIRCPADVSGTFLVESVEKFPQQIHMLKLGPGTIMHILLKGDIP